MQRNSTSFPKQNYEILKKIKRDEKDPLRYHQRIVYEFVLQTPWVRGLVIYHKMGAGKSVLGNSICEGLLEQKPDRKIIFMAAKSLHHNFRDSIVQYRRMVAEAAGKPFTPESALEHIEANYQFISLNASNMLTQVHKAIKKEAELDIDVETTDLMAEEFAKLEQIGDLEGSVLVIDEAHNLFNSISNGSKNAVGLYQLIMKARDIKVIFLTGSPIVNDPFEFAIAMNMVAGPLKGDHTLFGEDYMDFTKYFVAVDTNVQEANIASDDAADPAAPIRHATINHRDKFINRIVGLVSYYGADDAAQRKLYPTQLATRIEHIPMSGRQYAAYITARDRELEETSRGAKFTVVRNPLQKPQGMSSSYRVRSRQLSNALFPDYASKTYKDARGYLRYEKFIDKILDVNLRNLGSKGMGDETKFGLEIWSPKILKLMQNIQRHCPFKFIEKPTKSESGVKNVKDGKKGKDSGKKVSSAKKAKGGETEDSLIARPIEEKDWATIEQIHGQFLDTYEKPSNRAVGFVALYDDEIIAYIIIEPKGEVKYVRTVRQYRRRNAISMLLALARDTFPKLKYKLSKKYVETYPFALSLYYKAGFKLIREDSDCYYLETNGVAGSGELMPTVRLMERKDTADAIELYKKINGVAPDVDFTDHDVKVYLCYVGEVLSGLGIIKPGYASISKTREHTNYLVDVAVVDLSKNIDQFDATLDPSRADPKKVPVLDILLERMRKDYPQIYLKLDRSQARSGLMKNFYEDHEFYVYRESDGYWYLRHVIGAKEKETKGAPVATKDGLGPGLIYSQFIDSGVKLVGRVLVAHGFVEIRDITDALKHKSGAAFAIISGEVDPDLRSEIVKIYNSPENQRGEHLAILLVTSTGAEGLDLKNIRHIHVLEPYWHWARIAQVLARGVRMGSHMSLPESERNVQPYIYLSDYPPADVINQLKDVEHIRKQMAKEDTTDVTLYKKSINNQKLIDSFLIAAQEASMDCPIHYGTSKNCRMCAPTDEKLFLEDLDKDIRTPSRCQPLKETSVKAKSITVDDAGVEREFMYAVGDVDGKKTVHIYEYIASLDAYDEIFEENPHYETILAAVKKREKIR